MNKTADWLFYAESDLKTAKAALNEEVTNNGQETPRTHDLLFIFERVKPFNQELSKFNDYLQFLNQLSLQRRFLTSLAIY